MPMRRNFPLRLLSALAAALALGGCSDQPPLEQGAIHGSGIGGAFELVNPDGETVRWSDFEGKWRMVYFGYAYCPDVCPFDVQRMVQGYNAFAAEEPELAQDVVPIFITIDPQRDTPDVVGKFVSGFSEDLVGLTGTQEQIDEAANAFAVYYRKGTVTEEGGYLMDHSNVGYLMDRDGAPVALLSVDETGEAVAQELKTWVR